MVCRYIALIGNPPGFDRQADPVTVAALTRLGLDTKFAIGRTTFCLSRTTPIRHIQGGGTIIGHIFPRSRTSSGTDIGLTGCTASRAMQRRVLTEFWGDYLLVQATDEDDGISLLRDPSGGVPCVYSLKNGGGFITSDISLAATLGLYRREVDWEFIAHCLAFPTHKAQRTALADISEVPPGCTLTLERGQETVSTAWTPWDFVVPEARHKDPASAAADIRNAVTSAVQAWASTDESVLVELSGGLDSSIVAASLKGTTARVTLCTLKTPIPGTDERYYAQQVADHLGLPLHMEDLAFDTVGIDVAPLPSSTAPRMGVLQHAVSDVMVLAGERHGANSYLSGAGGDTVFCYLGSAAPATDALRTKGFRAWASTVNDLAALHNCTVWRAGRLSLKKLMTPPPPHCRPDLTFLNSSWMPSSPERHPWLDRPDMGLPGDHERIVGLAGTQIFRDITPRGALRPMRMPLLSQPVVEAALKAPTWMWVAGGRNRAVARDAFADALPAEVLLRQSKGTFAGYLGALYQRSRPQIRALLLDGRLRQRRMLDADAVEIFLSQAAPPKDQSYLRILSLCMVENWLRHHD